MVGWRATRASELAADCTRYELHAKPEVTGLAYHDAGIARFVRFSNAQRGGLRALFIVDKFNTTGSISTWRYDWEHVQCTNRNPTG